MTTMKILFLAANPAETDRLALGDEVRAIEECIRQADHRDRVELIAQWAVQPDDLIVALNRHQPHVVHFSGHGSASNELLLASDDGDVRPVPARALTALFRVVRDRIRLVVLNACYSAGQGNAIAEHVDCVVGMRRALDNQVAIHFAAALYRALAFGRSVENSFHQGLVALGLQGVEEQDNPQLLISRPGVEPDQVRLLACRPASDPSTGSGANDDSILLLSGPERERLVELLLALRVMRDPAIRRRIVDRLGPGIAPHIDRHSSSNIDVRSIVEICADHDGGIERLLTMSRRFEGETRQMRALDSFLEQAR